jgi:hypothetical protein
MKVSPTATFPRATGCTLAAMGFLTFLFGGCNKGPEASSKIAADAPSSKPLSTPPEVTADEEEKGFHDLSFYIQEQKELPDGTQIVRVAGTHKGDPLSIDVVLGADWKAGSLGKDVPIVTYQGVVLYRSNGLDSDAFIRVLDELYGTKVHPKSMGKEIRFTAISLEGDPRKLGNGPVKIKLFFESREERDYAELFTNIDVTHRRLEVREKDPEYRLQVIKALQAY